jgi:hypothetical protein
MALSVLTSLAPAQAQTVDEIVARHEKALGGIERLRAIGSVRMKGLVTAGEGGTAIVVREVRRPGQVRTEFTYQGVTGVYAFDGERGWKVSPFDGSFAPVLMESEEARQTADQAEIEGPLADWKAKGHRVSLSGKENLGGREVVKLEVTLRSGRVLHEFLDAVTYLPLRRESSRLVRGHSVTIETTFGDYREVGGVLFPHSIETGAAGRPQRLKITVEAIEVNPALDEARFQMPAPGR